MLNRLGVTAAFLLILTATTQPADAFFFGILKPFFQPFPLYGIRTYVEPTAIGTAYVNQFPFTTPPAPDCLQRALRLLNGCQPFLNAINANGGQLTKFTIFQILQLAIVNKTADVTCYNAVASFLNGGCICDNGLIATINVLNTVPAFAKQAITQLNKAKCPASPPPPPVSPFPTAGAGAGTPPVATAPPTTVNVAVGAPPAVTTPSATGAPATVNVAVGGPPVPSGSPLPGGRRLFDMHSPSA